MATDIVLALDWTPNTNHTGFYVARAKGWYKEAGLDVSFWSPHEDSYALTPGQRLSSGRAAFAVAPSETVISAKTSPATTPLVAVATILQKDSSAIVTLKSSGIDRPKKLDGRKYASYGARYEGRIVQQLIMNDGGTGDYEEITPPKLGIFDGLVKGEGDATWVFMGWEGVEASRRGVGLNAFSLEEYGVPYGYTPLLVTTQDYLRSEPDIVSKFVHATARGFHFAAKEPGEAADLLVQSVAEDTASQPLPEPLRPAMVQESQALVSRLYLDEAGQWGRMGLDRWEAFLDWLSQKGLLTAHKASRNPQEGVSATLDELRAGKGGEAVPRESIQASSLFTNEFLKEGSVRCQS